MLPLTLLSPSSQLLACTCPAFYDQTLSNCNNKKRKAWRRLNQVTMELIGTIISSFNDSMYKTQILEQTKEMRNQLKSGLSLSQCAHWTKDLWFQTVSSTFMSLALLSVFLLPPRVRLLPVNLCVWQPAFKTLCKSASNQLGVVLRRCRVHPAKSPQKYWNKIRTFSWQPAENFSLANVF